MRELRTCPVSGVTVLLNDAWPAFPPTSPADVDTRQAHRGTPSGEPCPWCAPPTRSIAHLGGPEGALTHAVPHPTPALGVEGDARVHTSGDRAWREAVGAHELLLGPHAGDDPTALRLALHRIADLRRDTRLRGFRAHRRDRVSTHALWQLLALPYDLAPQAPAPWRDAELAAGVRVVERTERAVAILAWAPRAPFEVWILPTEGRVGFEAAHGDHDLDAVLALSAVARTRIRAGLGPVDIDLTVVDGEPWRLELRPVWDVPTPVEAATGLPLHGALPEQVAQWWHRT